MKLDIEQLKEGGIELAVGTTATILSLHAVRRMPNNYVGLVLLGAGVLGYMVNNKAVKTASIVIASLGAVKALNMLALDNGVPAVTGFKGMVNKVVPQLNGVEGVAGLGDIERTNENLLGTGDASAEDLLGLGTYDEHDTLQGDELDKLTGVDDEQIQGLEDEEKIQGLGEDEERMQGFGSLM